MYCEVPGHNFGLLSAVINFNRFPELAVAVARRLMWIVNEHYFDDKETGEPGYALRTGQQYLVELSSDRFFGFHFADDKGDAMDDATTESV